MIKRILKVILFLPVCLISGIFIPIYVIKYLITGEFPEPLLEYLIEW